MAGANLLGTYQFRPTARVRPYALAGIGYQRVSWRSRIDVGPSGVLTVPRPILTFGVDDDRIADTGGLGLDVPLERLSLYVEARATLGPPRGDGPSQGLMTPVTLGLRF